MRLPVALLALVVVILGGAACGSAQSLPGFSLASPAPSGSMIDALFTSAPVSVDGTPVLRIAVPAGPTSLAAVSGRANDIAVAIDQVLATREENGEVATVFDPATMHVEVARVGGQTVIEVTDAHHRSGLSLVTVTSADADYNQMGIERLAEQWQSALDAALRRALQIRQPEIRQENLTLVRRVGIALAVVTISGYFGLLVLSRRIARLTPGRELRVARATRAIVVALLALVWFAAVTWGCLQFPRTVALGKTLLNNALALAAIWLATFILDRALSIAVDRLPALWELHPFGRVADQARQLQRAPTIARALAGFKTAVLVFVALLATMTQLGIPVASVVTIGGLAAIAVSLAAQNLIRDVVSGFLILLEDQFVVGDTVTINGVRGDVERLTLRIVQIRADNGSLVTLANSTATTVANHSRDWSQLDFEVLVDPKADLDAAIAAVRGALRELAADEAWRGELQPEPEWIGIDGIARDGASIKARIKTSPLRQFALRRELNLRIARAFAKAAIAFGAPLAGTTT
jgi:small conductance mechanosensitive channel